MNPCCFFFLLLPWSLIELPLLHDVKTTSLTMNVAGVIKDGLLIAFSRSIIRDTINPVNLFLYDVTFLSVSYYNKGPCGLFSHHIHPSLGFLWISGIMVKTLDDFGYSASKRCEAWLKVKRDYVEGIGDSIDLVLISAWHGNGRKVGWIHSLVDKQKLRLKRADNLCKDIFLRGKMDDQGWVPVSLITTFNMVKRVTTSIAMILNALRDSTELEIQQRKLEDERIG
ncbi:uncharacterized protein LOC121992425 isoform X2 [Zingiber officinale]|uniref:uncharacterized protein LOC121992425 isoform X2 n=1 Tax=Zingiber officinale TaxID=94328 RepID=UPI001C4BF0D8|nr:uncharacterized protein LOC121992425 isoform X2 [Zingiber officinale]